MLEQMLVVITALVLVNIVFVGLVAYSLWTGWNPLGSTAREDLKALVARTAPDAIVPDGYVSRVPRVGPFEVGAQPEALDVYDDAPSATGRG